MIYPDFANRPFHMPLEFGNLRTNNELVKWMAKQDTNYLYNNHKSNLYIVMPNIGWLRFGNNAAIKSLYLNMIVIENRCQGHGTKTIEMLKMFSDERMIPISLICCPMQGSEIKRLEEFYVRRLFIFNQGFYVYEKMEASKEINLHQVATQCSSK